ncbi:MAG: biotin--[acetyl-CoA-carboxylase] ligase [Deltaproteobacteria bacterium CG11_big_fil_rev_8_21_14_0_20_47_16]|nr:MAG: biotin--[acetyl-CoA-carboxylase] ligase [Deltaproteobacteria bacterium CG11_big_fil_rev_8_21_14_0_20_47_16]
MAKLPDKWVLKPHSVVESTNTVANQMALQGAPEGTVVAADAQTQGRGRWGRSWESPSGKNLYISVVLRPHILPDQVPVLALAAGLATVEMLAKEYGVSAQVKWPNDIWLSDRKLGGILAELHTDGPHVGHVIVGLGLNVNSESTDFSPDVASIATSLKIATGKAHTIDELASKWCHYLEHRYREFKVDGFGGMQPEYERVLAWKGDRVRIDGMGPEVTGVITGVDVDGRLVLKNGDEASFVSAGEVVKVCSS